MPSGGGADLHVIRLSVEPSITHLAQWIRSDDSNSNVQHHAVHGERCRTVSARRHAATCQHSYITSISVSHQLNLCVMLATAIQSVWFTLTGTETEKISNGN